PVAVIDEDGSPLSKAVVAGLGSDSALAVSPATPEAARASVRGGKTTVAVVLPKNFGDSAATSFFRGAGKPRIDLLYDPSHTAEVQMVRGILTQHVMESVSKEVFSSTSSTRYLDQLLGDLDKAKDMPGVDRRALVDMLGSVKRWSQV